MQGTKIIIYELMEKGKSLRNILKDGLIKIVNNFCEKMKPVKVFLKNCMDISNEDT